MSPNDEKSLRSRLGIRTSYDFVLDRRARMKKKQWLFGCIVVAVVSLLWVIFGRSSSVSVPTFKSEAEARGYLKEQVAEGRLSELEARVHLAEALSRVKKQERRQTWRKAYEADIQRLMEEEGVSKDEAMVRLKSSKKKQWKSKSAAKDRSLKTGKKPAAEKKN